MLYGIIPVLYVIGISLVIRILRRKAEAQRQQELEQQQGKQPKHADLNSGRQQPRPAGAGGNAGRQQTGSSGMDAALARIERKLEEQKAKRTVKVKDLPRKPQPQPKDMAQIPKQHRPHHPREYDAVHVPHPTELQRHAQQLDKAALEAKEKQEQSVRPQQHNQQMADRTQRKRQAPGPGLTMTQAIIWSEILGKPKALQRRRRF